MLLHLSDLHFGTEKPECLAAIQKFCRDHPVEAIAISGDLTQRARFFQFLSCKSFLESLGPPYLVVPGNHDIPLYHVLNRVFNPFMRYQLFFGALESILETEHFYLIGVNSIRRRFHTKGHISLEQIQQVALKLQAAPSNKYKIVVAHQPFYTSLRDSHVVKDCPVLGRMALEIWGKQGACAVLHGHLHQTAIYDLNQIYQLNVNHPVYEVHAGTATSHRLRKKEPNSFNVVTLQGEFQSYVFDVKKSQFVLKGNP
ncbi:metallophosphoesterase family protein [Acinetobacter sp. MB5]|uniref:metallophosphoesterase family protein n=1 Tax=Acinetobacter sp. MB5 TaxID=2069438 RepID=UPI000DCF8177|nr:metallophosphoesterase [Acinetobacter sp. MB5]